ncbi:MAG: hypothetical protein ACOH1Y_06600 [Propionicimonas sp.]
MNARGHRAVASLGLALAGVLLSGCNAQGTFDVLSEERVAVDLTVSGPEVSCPHSADELKLVVTEATDQFGDTVCHVTGETQATYFSTFGITISPAAEYLVLQANLSGGRDSWPTADIAVRFPGKVVDATQGTIEDNIVRITDLDALTQGSGLRAVGLRSSAPPAWVLASLTGAGVGIALTLVVGFVVWLLRRPARIDLAEPLGAVGDAALSIDPQAPTEPRSFAAAEPSSTPAPGSPDDNVPAASDTSWFARPPTAGEPMTGSERPGETVPPHPQASEPLQRAAWAPPEDH